MCRVAGKALYCYGLQNAVPVRIFSMHDSQKSAEGNRYFPAEMFLGFNASKIKFIMDAVDAGSKSKVVILSHINLLVAGWLIKKMSPSTQVILMAHGIEIWQPLSKRKLMMLHSCDKILSVSSYTNEKIKKLHNLSDKKCSVLNNCIDPYLTCPAIKERSEKLTNRYGFTKDDVILLTLTRISKIDRYKGYDYVLEAIAAMGNTNLKYLLAGSYDADEAAYVKDIAVRLGLSDRLILAGFVPEEELHEYFSTADIYVMPSMKEGFGIVFIEAMFYGLPVIAGNADGSSDALQHGRLGILIPPEKPSAIVDALQKILLDRNKYIPDQKLLKEHFSYETYKHNLEKFLN